MQIYDTIIIGSGPAAYTASIYLRDANYNVLVLEGFNAGGYPPGGQLTSTSSITNYPGVLHCSGQELMDVMRTQSTKISSQNEMETVCKINYTNNNLHEVITEDNTYYAYSIIIATWASAKKLDFVGSDKFWNNGISSCAICDGHNPRFKNSNVVVIGGGNTAIEYASYLSKLAKYVFIIVRKNNFRVNTYNAQNVLKLSNVSVLYNKTVIKADGNSWIENITLNDNTIIQTAGVFYAIGHIPNTDFIKNSEPYNNILTDGYIDLSLLHNIRPKGVFVAGDVIYGAKKQACIAAGSGANAALDAITFLETK